MSKTINSVWLSGTIIERPRLYESDAYELCELRVEVEGGWRDEDGVWRTKSERFRVYCKDELAQSAAKHGAVGAFVEVLGKIHYIEGRGVGCILSKEIHFIRLS